MNEENQPLVTDELFNWITQENYWSISKEFQKISQLNKGKREDVNKQQVWSWKH